jgi:uncharacterized OsmC-like protein
MLGTLNGALAVRGIHLQPGQIRATVEGVNELRDGMVTLTTIHVHYNLTIPSGTRDAVDRALSRHREKCPTAHSLRGAVAVEWTADVEEQTVES